MNSAFAYQARGDAQRLFWPLVIRRSARYRALRCLAPLGAATGSWLGWLLEVIIGGQVLEEVTLLLHDAVELVTVDGAITVTVSLVDHVLEFLIVDGLAKLLSNTGEVLEGNLRGGVV